MSPSEGPRARLEGVLSSIGRAVVAVSGGVDSLTLATAAGRMRGPGLEVVHAVSAAVPAAATRRVREGAVREGWALTVLDAGEFDDEEYLSNPVDRCRFCKAHLYDAIRSVSSAVILSGTNADDLGDYRPGLEAAATRHVRHPYVEAAIDKPAVRGLARELGLGDVAELPAAPCLASRVETGIRVEASTLAFVEWAERHVREALDATVVRARIRREGIVIELDPEALARARNGGGRRLARRLRGMAAEGRPGAAVRFAPYRMGSAFQHPREGA